MTSPLTTAMTTLKTTWEAVTPPTDGSSLSYAFVDSLIEERGNGQHRKLMFGRPRSGQIIAETPIQCEWQIDVMLFLSRFDRTYEAFYRAIADETALLINAYSDVTSWGSGVIEAHFDSFDINDNLDRTPATAGGIRNDLVARIDMHFRVLTMEA